MASNPAHQDCASHCNVASFVFVDSSRNARKWVFVDSQFELDGGVWAEITFHHASCPICCDMSGPMRNNVFMALMKLMQQLLHMWESRHAPLAVQQLTLCNQFNKSLSFVPLYESTFPVIILVDSCRRHFGSRLRCKGAVASLCALRKEHRDLEIAALAALSHGVEILWVKSHKTDRDACARGQGSARGSCADHAGG
eukprot:2779326-Amphidinium_carterae.1